MIHSWYKLLLAAVIGLMTLAGCSDSQTSRCETAADCNDGNDCTADLCDPGTGACSNPSAVDGTTCDFSGAAGVCMSGVCQEDLCDGVDCDDENPCTRDACNAEDGSCGHDAREDGTPCDFGGLPGKCHAGVCENANLCEGVDCTDGNECTEDVCDPRTTACSNPPVADGTPCNGGASFCIGGRCSGAVCNRAPNDAIYENLDYLDGDGVFYSGAGAARAVSFDCVFGTPSSEPPLEGCGQQAATVLGCAIGSGCPPELIDALEDCIVFCMQEAIETIVGEPLTEDCGFCYGPNAACNVSRCAEASCGAMPTSPTCMYCRCEEGCPQDFAVCSGLPDDECD